MDKRWLVAQISAGLLLMMVVACDGQSPGKPGNPLPPPKPPVPKVGADGGWIMPAIWRAGPSSFARSPTAHPGSHAGSPCRAAPQVRYRHRADSDTFRAAT